MAIAAVVAASFSVVIPTLGRPSLWATIASVVDQLDDGDELVVVADVTDVAVAGRVLQVVNDFVPAALTYVEVSSERSAFGNAQRDGGMAIASGSHLVFLDDDDVYRHGGLDVVRDRVSSEFKRNSAHVFRAEWGPGHHAHGALLWTEPVVREGNVGTPMVVLPNRRYSRSWMDGNERGWTSDYAFLEAAIAECDDVAWHTEIVATVRP